MYAVIMAGGKQYRVEENGRVFVEKQNLDLGEKITFDQVLLASKDGEVLIGKPYVNNCKVTASVQAHGKHDKIEIIKFKRRKHHLKRMGHRQLFTELKIENISFAG